MAKRADDLLDDPAVVLIEAATESFDVWLSELSNGEPLDLTVNAAEVLAEARAESGWA